MYMGIPGLVEDYRIDEMGRLHRHIKHYEKLTKDYLYIGLPLPQSRIPTVLDVSEKALSLLWPEIHMDISDVDFNNLQSIFILISAVPQHQVALSSFLNHWKTWAIYRYWQQQHAGQALLFFIDKK